MGTPLESRSRFFQLASMMVVTLVSMKAAMKVSRLVLDSEDQLAIHLAIHWALVMASLWVLQ
jgi:hypothetical protein